ncbi:DUF1800 domain-containing protein [Sphingomonas sp. CL5.1]|uniref:DUF1800 domain-containing protein n=1 Tax=Sphingomonas sp. CL5.1 TaxID=2653203 RepID=UPI0015841E2B|nr:DUF1800 domain-containing protein [Sphingomonas sp. CL5.1]QKR99484.1 DUF1800 domain-containing protein [Sphingomonas sp. CL5.1]
MPPSASLSPAAIAMNRFGLGARPDDTLPADPKGWLKEQFVRFQPATAAFAALPDAGELVRTYLDEQRQLRRQASREQMASPVAAGTKSIEQKAARRDYAQDVQALYRQAVQARAQAALDTPAPFVERLVHFWSNHFCVSADNPQVTAFAGAFERDAIRPHVLGRFEDMLLAVEHHPAMLIYLNQIQSIGPDSLAAQRAARRNPEQRRGLNENLGREIMELHTLGVRSGYGQGDVTEFARALTGWSVAGIGPGGATDGRPGDFLFRPQLHEPGARTILGKRYGEDGEAQARAALIDFARAPATVTHVATKLARHFAGDAPPPALVERLAASFQRSGGALPALYRALIDSPEPWQPRPLKFKTPWEWTISALRGLGRSEIGAMQVAAIQNQLGQPVWKPGSPAGWDDIAASWAGPDALLRRVDFAQRLVAPVGDRLDARQLGPRLLPASFSRATAEEVGRAESPGDALALLLVSPDFLRR